MDAINIQKAFPAAYKAYYAASMAAENAAEEAGIEPELVDLVKLRVSQINGCAFCLRSHSKEAIEHGESPERLAVLAAWWESQYFSEAEQAALTIAENVTRSDREYPMHPESARAVLNESQIAAITWLSIIMNGWNRIAVSSHYPVAP